MQCSESLGVLLQVVGFGEADVDASGIDDVQLEQLVASFLLQLCSLVLQGVDAGWQVLLVGVGVFTGVVASEGAGSFVYEFGRGRGSASVPFCSAVGRRYPPSTACPKA